MDITPIYELQARLRAAAIAGVNLLQEDFRLKRAAEAIKPLESASPVFAKLNQQMALLLSSDRSNSVAILLDTISLTDAVICTLGTVEVKKEIQEYEVEQVSNRLVINAPCSQVKALIEALTTSGSGNYACARDMHDTHPEIFDDYRVKSALIQALGASYGELADMVAYWLEKEDKSIIPMLKKGFDPKGKKEMVRRVQVIEAIAGAEENEFYISMLAEAEKDVRLALIYALRHEPSNIELLLNMAKSEKGKHKQMVLDMLALIENEKVYDLFRTLGTKKPLDVLQSLLPSTTESASKIVAELCMKQLPEIIKLPQNQKSTDEAKVEINKFCKTVEALVGKHGEEVCDCYRQILAQKEILDQIDGMNIYVDVIRNNSVWKNKSNTKLTWEYIIGYHMAQSILIYPDEKLQSLVLELYENNGARNINFLTAASVTKIFQAQDCAEWLEQQIKSLDATNKKLDKPALDRIERALSFFVWNTKADGYVVRAWYTWEDLWSWRDGLKSITHEKRIIPDADGIKDWMMQHGSKQMDAILRQWVNLSNSDECAKYGEYFYKRAFTTSDNGYYLTCMRECKWKNCKGLGVFYIENEGKDGRHLWSFINYLRALPGDYDTIREELDAVIDVIKSGKVKLKYFDTPKKIEELLDEIERLKLSDTFYALRQDEEEGTTYSPYDLWNNRI